MDKLCSQPNEDSKSSKIFNVFIFKMFGFEAKLEHEAKVVTRKG